MADRTVARRPDTSEYDLGRSNWDAASIPDLAHPKQTTELASTEVIDVVVLGDGFLDEREFEAALQEWIDDFYDVWIYDAFRGAFRVRALFTRSRRRASEDRRSFYRVKLADGGVSDDGWWADGGAKNQEFRDRLFASLEQLGVNEARYPSNLDVGGNPVIHNTLDGMYSNLVACLLVRTADADNASGRTRDIPGPGGARLNVALGAYSLHELGHAFAYLEDEYIGSRGTRATRENPGRPSLFTLSNLTFSDRLADALWLHLSPWGTSSRTAAVGHPSPIVGWLWRGGEHDQGVWHSEYQCLMNGTHENYLYTPDSDADDALTGGASVNLRSRDRYCLWCEEIVAARILEKTGQLRRPNDPADVNARGRRWHDAWVSTWRARYWAFASLSARVAEREAFYADMANFPDLDANGLALWRSPLYDVFVGQDGNAGSPPAGSDDAEELLILMAR